MRYVEEYDLISEKVSLVPFNEKYPIHLFKSGIEDYDNFLREDARKYIELGISSVHLLIENGTDFILGYIALLTDSFLLKPEEKTAAGIDTPFNSTGFKGRQTGNAYRTQRASLRLLPALVRPWICARTIGIRRSL
jgi:hypothetical protein